MRNTLTSVVAASTLMLAGTAYGDSIHFPYFVQAPNIGLTSAVSVMTQRPGAGVNDPFLFPLKFTYIYKGLGASNEEACNKVDNFAEQSSNDFTTWVISQAAPIFEPVTPYNELFPIGGDVEGQLVVYQDDNDFGNPEFGPTGEQGELAGEIIWVSAQEGSGQAIGSLRAVNNPNSGDPDEMTETGFGSTDSLISQYAEDAAPSLFNHPGVNTTWFIAVTRDGMVTAADNQVPDLAVEISVAFYNSDGDLVPGLYADRQENIFSTNKRTIIDCFGRVRLEDLFNGPELAKIQNDGFYARLTITDYDPKELGAPTGSKSIMVYKVEDLGDTLLTSENRIDF